MLTAEEIKKLEDIQPTLVSLYKEAGYERAIELQSRIESITGKSIFDIVGIGVDAANCFHCGTWQVWHGDGVVDMKDMIEGGYYDSVESIIEKYKGNAIYVKMFVKVAEEYLKAIEH